MSKISKQLTELFETRGADLYRLSVRLVLDEQIAEDIMQDLFIKLASIKDLNKIRNLTAYARRMTMNMCFDQRETKSKNNMCSLDNVSELQSNNSIPVSKLIQTEQLEEILDAIGHLKGETRTAFLMRYVQQESYEDIAYEMGKSQHQVRALCYKGLNHLRYLLCGGELKNGLGSL